MVQNLSLEVNIMRQFWKKLIKFKFSKKKNVINEFKQDNISPKQKLIKCIISLNQ